MKTKAKTNNNFCMMKEFDQMNSFKVDFEFTLNKLNYP